MRTDDTNEYDDYDYGDGDDLYADAERLYQAAYDEVYGSEDDADDLTPQTRWPWWRTRQGQVALLVGGVVGVVILMLLVRGVNLPEQDVMRITATPATPPAGAPGIVPTAQPSLAVSASWPTGIEFVPNSVPAMIKNTIGAVGQRHGYLFDGQAGDVWLITVEPQDGLDPLVTLYAPSGELLGANDDRSDTDLTSEIQVMLPENGSYRVVVESAAGGLTVGSYVLALLDIG